MLPRLDVNLCAASGEESTGPLTETRPRGRRVKVRRVGAGGIDRKEQERRDGIVGGAWSLGTRTKVGSRKRGRGE